MNRGPRLEKEEAPRVQSRGQKSKRFKENVSVQPESRELVRFQFVSLFEITEGKRTSYEVQSAVGNCSSDYSSHLKASSPGGDSIKGKRARRFLKWAMAVGNALRDGTLIRLPCAICGDPLTQEHHRDFAQPLDVTWYCFKHQRELAHDRTVSPGVSTQYYRI
jgi:hypothetical protein